MLQWLSDSGADFKKIGVHSYDPSDRCVVSTARIEVSQSLGQKNELLLFVPLRCMITIELAQTSPTVRVINSRRLELCSPKHCTLAIYLLEQKASEESPFK
ncbi:MAG: hypothetical protein JST59_02060 [Actinobacteria bacterium]|nr:hypothetical protein [Actinomycetota bacterium]